MDKMGACWRKTNDWLSTVDPGWTCTAVEIVGSNDGALRGILAVQQCNDPPWQCFALRIQRQNDRIQYVP